MGPKTPVPEGDLFRHPLREQINLTHPLVRLVELIDWNRLSVSMSESFVSRRGWSASSPRLIAGLLYLQHGFDLSNEEVVWQWVEKEIAHPTDSRLLEQCRTHLAKAAARRGLELWQNYNRGAPRVASQICRYAHAKQYKCMKKSLQTLRSRVGHAMRDVKWQLDSVAEQSRTALENLIDRTKRILTQKQKDKNKLYALHAPQVEYPAEGKARKPYKFGVKETITTTHEEDLVVGARSMPGNPYDGHMLAEALEQAAIQSDIQPEIAIIDRGYKGVAIDGVTIYHPGLRRGITCGPRAMIRRRSANEPAVRDMKADGKLGSNWLQGALGNAIHAALYGAGHNLRMILTKLRLLYAWILAVLLNRGDASPARHDANVVQNALFSIRT
ncbi:transposase [Burkholderia sp. BCC1630]|uniref:transposase n=1 Tax=Burkholderia sp. BCC1630 TaxID=2676304 RepID=UPI00158920C6|nr:transposase [Burkholderia sp. BCC1630]